MLIRLMVVIATFAAMATASAQSLNLKWTTKDGAVVKEQTLDLASLDKLTQHETITETPWTEGKQRFSGPSLEDLAKLGGVPVASAKLTALNDYAIDIPAADWESYPLILASRLDRNLMRVRDKGPFWVIYPLDAYPSLNIQFYHARMIWQVRDIVFTGL